MHGAAVWLNRVKVFEVKQSLRGSSTHHFHCQSPRGFVASVAGFRQGTDNMLNTRDEGQILHPRVTHGPASDTLKCMHLLMAYFSIILTKQPLQPNRSITRVKVSV